MTDPVLEADSLYGNLLGTPLTVSSSSKSSAAAPVPSVPEKPKAQANDGGAAKSNAAGSGDDMFADLPSKQGGPSSDAGSPTAASRPPVAQPAPAAVSSPSGSSPSGKDAASGASSPPPGASQPKAGQLPSTFSAAKLMMPPQRKRAEPMLTKRGVMPSLDIQKLQAEKEALLRQRASAASSDKKDDSKPQGGGAAAAGAAASAPSGPGLGASTAAEADAGDPPSAAVGSAGTAVGVAAASSVVAAASLYGSPDEEYDPAKPNDYDDFCRRRMRQKAEEEMERRRQEALARQQAAQVGGPAKAPEPKEEDFATRMMKKMGWKEGGGLGKEGQGIATPLVMKKTDDRAGVITEGQKRDGSQPPAGQPAAKQPKAEAPKPAGAPSRPPTRVLLLNNLVGAGEVDDDLEEETAEEAGKYGKLKKCVVKEIKGVPDTEAVRIFLEYERIEDATKALVDMNGRYFGGRVVRARFYDEQRYATGDLENRERD